jgi:hypothetical protein
MFSQAVDMKKVKVYEAEGRTREERETCFPKSFQKEETKGVGV